MSHEIESAIAPGGVRADVGTLPSVGRDGRAITAGIMPSTADRVFDLADQFILLQRERLTIKDNDPRQPRSSIQTVPPRKSDVTIPSSPQAARGIFGENRNTFIAAGIIGVAVIVALMVGKRLRR